MTKIVAILLSFAMMLALCAGMAAYAESPAEESVRDYITDEWIRWGTDAPQGLHLKVMERDGMTFAMILEDMSAPKAGEPDKLLHWVRGLHQWIDIRAKDENTFYLQDARPMYYSKTRALYHMENGLGRLDRAHDRIIVQTEQTGDVYWEAHKESAFFYRKSTFVQPRYLKDADLTVTLHEKNKGGVDEEKTLNLTKLGKNNPFAYLYKGNVVQAKPGKITIGSSWEDVVAEYGHGASNMYVVKGDPLAYYLNGKKALDVDGETRLGKVVEDQVDEYMEYSTEKDDIRMRVYFKNDVVTWICWYFKK